MSEPIPESIPISAARRGNREPPAKRRALSPKTKHASELEALFAKPDAEIKLTPGTRVRELAAPPEIVTNVQGSSAGAGSGEFHVYKASRRREAERLRAMDEEVHKEEQDREWEEKREKLRLEDEQKLNKNRSRRAKKKERQQKVKKGAMAKNGQAPQNGSHENNQDSNGAEENSFAGREEAHLSAKPVTLPEAVDEEEDEFTEDGLIISGD